MNHDTRHPISSEAAEILENRRREVTATLGALVEAHPMITLELGCGHGHFLTAYASAHSGEFCLGIDRQGNRITRSLRKQGHAGLPNLRFVRAEVRQFLDCLPEGMRLARIFVLFPDPWPKRRHIKNRMLGPSMLAILAQHAIPEAELFLRTDDFDYLEWVEANLSDSVEWRMHTGRVWPFERETVFQRKARSYRSLSAVTGDPARKG
ncbi:MAG: SAM-dependent methyltransferase [Verrucomicrobia bacterium]|nr:MAG: SAM-dependent methyltransferase [Verrucomicrobiota bacterium]